MSIVKLTNVNKKFGNKVLFDNFNLQVEEGEFIVVMGASGSGKSTLLNIIGMLEKADSGEIEIDGVKNPKFNSNSGVMLLRKTISYLFQNYGLIDSETVEFNLKTATKFLGYNSAEEKTKMEEALKLVGLAGFEKKKVYQLSGGEQQRVALAKILLKSSKLILADEPTGSLDPDNRDTILKLLQDLNKQGKTIIMVSHDPIVKQYATKHINL